MFANYVSTLSGGNYHVRPTAIFFSPSFLLRGLGLIGAHSIRRIEINGRRIIGRDGLILRGPGFEKVVRNERLRMEISFSKFWRSFEGVREVRLDWCLEKLALTRSSSWIFWTNEKLKNENFINGTLYTIYLFSPFRILFSIFRDMSRERVQKKLKCSILNYVLKDGWNATRWKNNSCYLMYISHSCASRVFFRM